MSTNGSLVDLLKRSLPGDRVVTDPDVVATYHHDEAEWAPHGEPLAVVRPRSAEDVQAVVRACITHQTPVVARGAGTGLSGGANATSGCVVLALDAMDSITEIDQLERYAVVGPGVVNDHLRTACAERGLWYPPDPASSPWSTIGGNVATNAGGLCCVKYGVTRDYVLGMQIVTGTGDLVRLGRKTAKGWPVTTSPDSWWARRARSGSSPRSPSNSGRCRIRSGRSPGTSTPSSTPGAP